MESNGTRYHKPNETGGQSKNQNFTPKSKKTNLPRCNCVHAGDVIGHTDREK